MAMHVKFPFGKLVSVLVTHVEASAGNFFVQINDQAGKLNALLVEIEQSVLSGRSKPPTASEIMVGRIYLVQYQEDSRWYRARVLRVNVAEQQCEVFFIDYGNTEIVSLSCVRNAEENFCELPPQSFECELKGFDRFRGDRFDEMLTLLNDTILDQELYCKSDHLKGKCVLVAQLFVDDKGTQSVLDAMQSSGAGTEDALSSGDAMVMISQQTTAAETSFSLPQDSSHYLSVTKAPSDFGSQQLSRAEDKEEEYFDSSDQITIEEKNGSSAAQSNEQERVLAEGSVEEKDVSLPEEKEVRISDKSQSSDEQLAVDSAGEVLEEKPALRAEEGERSDASGTLDMFETTTVKKKQLKPEQEHVITAACKEQNKEEEVAIPPVVPELSCDDDTTHFDDIPDPDIGEEFFPTPKQVEELMDERKQLEDTYAKLKSASAVDDLQMKELQDQLEPETYFSTLYKTQRKKLQEEEDEKAKQVQKLSNEIWQLIKERESLSAQRQELTLTKAHSEQLARSSAEEKQYSDLIARHKIDMSEKGAQIGQLEERNQQLTESLDQKMAENKELNANIKNKQEELEKSKDIIKEIDADREELKTRLAIEKKWKIEAVNKLAEIANRKQLVRDNSKKRNATSDDLRKKEKECRKLHQEQGAEQEKYNQVVTKFQGQMAEYQKDLQIQMEQIQKLKMELDSKDLMIHRLNSQIKQRALNTSVTDDDALTVPGF